MDNNGNRTKIVELGGRTVNYTYDPLNRLTREEIVEPGQDVVSMDYVHDSVGNTLTRETCEGEPPLCEAVTYTYNINDQILTATDSVGSTSYSYDTNGNLIEKTEIGDTVTYSYDDQNRLIAVSSLGHAVSYDYDNDDIRVAKTVDGVKTNYVVDKNRPYAQVLEERDGSNNLLASYVHGHDLISQHKEGQDYYYHTEALGSAVKLTDESQAQVAEYYYTAYGDAWDQTGAFADTNKYRFTGEQFDEETGFYYLRARYYDPTIGRFMTRDCESCGNSQRPLSLNKYLYGEANPVLYVDPSGHFAMLMVQNVIAMALQDGLRSARHVLGGLENLGGGDDVWWLISVTRQRELARFMSKYTDTNATQWAHWAVNNWIKLWNEYFHHKNVVGVAALWLPPTSLNIGDRVLSSEEYFKKSAARALDRVKKDWKYKIYYLQGDSPSMYEEGCTIAGWYARVNKFFFLQSRNHGYPFDTIPDNMNTLEDIYHKRGWRLKYDSKGLPTTYCPSD